MKIQNPPTQSGGFQKVDVHSVGNRYDKYGNAGGASSPFTATIADQFVRRSARVTFGSQTQSQVSPQEKLARMAKQLEQQNLQAYYISPQDEHLNEYLPENKKRIEWLTGFTGESAPLLVTPDKMHLYVDGRFHIQVDQEIDPAVVDGVKLSDGADKEMMETLKTLTQSDNAQKPFRIGYDPFILSPSRLKRLQDAKPADLPIEWVPVSGNLVDPTWTGRPSLPETKAFAINEAITGRSVPEKLASIRQEMAEAGADILPVTKLDEVAWLFNIRGGDIPYNPVLESYGILTKDNAYLFAPPEKISDPLKTQLAAQGVTVRPYTDYPSVLAELLSRHDLPKQRVLVDKSSVTLGTLNIIEGKADIVEKGNPVTMEKAIKNPTEIEKMALANLRASRGIVRHLAHVSSEFAKGRRFNEAEVRADLEAKYREEPEFFDLSFPTIPGIGTNSAIIHYSKADPENVGKPGDFYLLDSGCQYTGGTTDTTRTTVFGQPKKAQIEKYTAVLKAHIACANAKFPEGTNGEQVDAMCRNPMWNQGLNFAHGTGHGVGAFLNVHEGPNGISPRVKVAFKPGMVTSIEPGYYQADWGGIRLENLYYVKEDTEKTPFLGKKWLKFEQLTFVPFEKKLIDFSALTNEEVLWLKDYYQTIWNKLSPTLSKEEKVWLKDQCTIPRRIRRKK